MSIGNRIEQSVVEDKVDVNERFGLWGDAKCGVSVNRLHGKRQNSWNGNQCGTQEKDCWYCGRIHERGTCSARGRKCNKKSNINHFAVVFKFKQTEDEQAWLG